MAKRKITTILFIAVLLLVQQQAFSWGKTGHRVIGQIAQSHLSKKAKREIKKLLGNQNLAHVSNYMDDIKSNPAFDHTHTWHYANIDEGSTYAQMKKHPKGDLISAIEEQKQILKNRESSKEAKAQAIKFLVHLIGDIHQPFHAGREKDWGGNKIKVQWFREKSNIHAVWDSKLIDSHQMSYTELAAEINFVNKQQLKKWQSVSTVDMLEESNAIANKLYENVPEKLKYKYVSDNLPIVKQQLLIAGVRLAGVLNEVFN